MITKWNDQPTGNGMARRDYISDNLVDIRDRLKQYAKTTEAAAADPQLDPAPRAASPAIQPPPTPLASRTPVGSGERGASSLP